MTKGNPISDGLDRLLRGLQSAVKTAMDKVPYELAVFTGEHMHDTHNRDSEGNTTGANVLGRARNRTNQLYTKTRKLLFALDPDDPANQSSVEAKGLVFSVSYGIDKTKVPYAAIHEYGGTIKHPGGTLYTIGKNGQTIFQKHRTEKTIGTTKAHDIPIPARPYLKPGMEAFLSDPNGLPAIMRELETDLIELAR